MEKKTTVGPKGQIVIPKDIREKLGIKEYSEVIVEAIGDSIIIKRLIPEFVTYTDYYCTMYSKKLNENIDMKKIIEKQYERNLLD